MRQENNQNFPLCGVFCYVKGKKERGGVSYSDGIS